jgi:hypothetical protein
MLKAMLKYAHEINPDEYCKHTLENFEWCGGTIFEITNPKIRTSVCGFCGHVITGHSYLFDLGIVFTKLLHISENEDC